MSRNEVSQEEQKDINLSLWMQWSGLEPVSEWLQDPHYNACATVSTAVLLFWVCFACMRQMKSSGLKLDVWDCSWGVD